MADERERRWLPWSREKDTKAQLIGSVLGLLTAVIVSGSGVLRVDRFGYSDFAREMKTARLEITAQISEATSSRRRECGDVHKGFEARFDAIVKLDESTFGGLKACRDNTAQLRLDVRDLRRRINGIGR